MCNLIECPECHGEGTVPNPEGYGEICYTCGGAGGIKEPAPLNRSSMPLNESGYCGCGEVLNRGKFCNECMGI